MARFNDPDHYFHRSRLPFQSLIFLLPLLLLYELGTVRLLTDPQTGFAEVIAARSLLADAFSLLGVGGYYLPGLVVVAVLIGMHVVRRDPWQIEPPLYLMMAIEALAWSVALLVFAFVSRGRPAVAESTLAADLVFAIGAGVYEELVFRLIAILLLHLLLVDVIRMRHTTGSVIAVVVAAALFSVYHFYSNDMSGQQIDFSFAQALFYFLGGLYFGTLFVMRGFGIAAGAHAFYDIIFVLTQHHVLPWSVNG